MSYTRITDDMEDIWDWVSHPYLEEEQVVSRTPKNERDYDLPIPLPPTPISTDEEAFKYEEEPSEEVEPSDEIGEYLHIVQPIQIRLPTRIVRRLRKRKP
ncbi:unnamed protein product [Lactuca saligna]|uniref:Uncharacterized protein n=1 Tax=Lactuca saligna TaxID=75948 RepID=A0AA35Z6K6_LACSI|nr:unnamed protein product [Lactuca saligna]